MDSKGVVTELFKSSAKNLHRYIKKIVHSDETANEITQEAFLRTFQHADKLDTPRAFLFSIAKNLALDSKRHDGKVRFEQRADLGELSLMTDELPEDLLIALERSDALREAIEQLTPKCREVFTQRVFFGWSYRQIAQKYRISERTVENHIAIGLRETTRVLRRGI